MVGHKDGVIYDLAELYNKGEISAESVAKMYGYHLLYDTLPREQTIYIFPAAANAAAGIYKETPIGSSCRKFRWVFLIAQKSHRKFLWDFYMRYA